MQAQNSTDIDNLQSACHAVPYGEGVCTGGEHDCATYNGDRLVWTGVTAKDV